MYRDDNPALGPKKQRPAHIELFFSWAAERDVLTIARCTEAITWSDEEPLLLSGVLAFLSQCEVADTLEAWIDSTNSPLVTHLHRLSRALTVSFPNILTPSPTQVIQERLHGRLEDGYLGAMFAARQAPDLNELQQDGLNCLRLWIFVKALEYAREGHVSEGNLHKACSYTRSALDSHAPRRRLWLSSLSEPSTSFRWFEDALVAACKRQHGDEDSPEKSTRKALQNLAVGSKRKHKFDPGVLYPTNAALDPQLWDEVTRTSAHAHLPATISFGPDGLEQVFLPNDMFYAARVSARDNPDRQSAKVRRIALQTVEERQFLNCSWTQIRPDEQLRLSATIDECLRHTNSESALTAAFIVLAKISRRTMETVGALELTAALEPDWTVDLDGGRLQRRPARPNVRWKQDANSDGWTKNLAREWKFELQQPLIDVLRTARHGNPAAKTLKDLWGFDRSPYAAFRLLCRDTPGLERIGSHAIGIIGERIAFAEHGDATYARLLMAPPTAGIAGAGSYPSWPLHRPNQFMESLSNGLLTSTASTVELECNGLGSELDPDDALLREAFSRAAMRLERCTAEDGWIAQHNRLTAYMVAALLASTGGRSSRSPFESITHFDLHRRRVYVEDKATAQMADVAQGRIVPLPNIASELMSTAYLPYLRLLAEQLEEDEPALAIELGAHAGGQGSAKLPLFFFLRERPSFAWLEVSEISLKNLGDLDWPLPWNLFRHRMATRLRQAGLDPELIDAQLGHAEVGSESFGDTSTRCWLDDEPEWRVALQTAIAPLEIAVPRLSAPKFTPVARAPGYRLFREASLFGRLARSTERKRNRDEARRTALQDIEIQVGTRPPNSLTHEQWECIGRSMLLQDGNIPQPNAAIRYEVFEDYVQRLWREDSVRVPLRRRYFKIPVPRSGHNGASLHAHDSLAPIQTALTQSFKRTVSQQSVRNAALLAALDMATTSRLADLDVLNAVATADGSRIRLVIESQTAYLDYREIANADDDQPARRFVIPARSAPLLNKALISKAENYQRKNESQDILHIIHSAPPGSGVDNRQKLLEYVARMVDLENSLALPGVVCAVLAGRTLTYSLSHSDWIRAKHDQRRVPNAPSTEMTTQCIDRGPEAAEPTTEESAQGEFRMLFAAPSTRARVDVAAKVDHDLLEKVRRLLRYLAGEKVAPTELESVLPSARLKNSNNDSAARSAAKSAIRGLLKDTPPDSSYSVRLLVAWVADLLERKNRRGGGKLRPRSILRYLSALSSGFMSYGRNADIRAMSESQLTDFYLNVVDSALHAAVSELEAVATLDEREDLDNHSPQVVHEDNQNVFAPQARSLKVKTSQAYVLERLLEFHRFAARMFELSDPDWSEIGDGLSASTVSPGFITPAEYLKSLSLICPASNSASIEDLRCAFVLLLIYRFGLRSGEAISMSVSDWVEVEASVVVLVNGTHAAVKTSGSRRQVPLMGSLTPLERSIVDAWMTHWRTETRSNRAIPMFFRHPLAGGIADIEPVRRRIVAVLRTVTGVTDLKLHKTRHSFANVLAINAVSPNGLSIWKSADFPGTTQDKNSIDHAQVVTGSTRSTRRRLWAISRALGHSATSTTCGSYLHFMGEWCAYAVMQQSTASFALKKMDALDRFIKLDNWIVDETYLKQEGPPEQDVPNTLTPLVAIKYMRAVARGIPTESASHRLNISPADSIQLHAAILTVAARAKDRSPFEIGRAEELPLRLSFLQGIKPARWDALMDLVSHMVPSDMTSPDRDPLAQIGSGFQILAFRREHFENIQRFLSDLGWSGEMVRFFRPQSLDAVVVSRAKEFGFELESTSEGDGVKRFQLAALVEYEADESSAARRSRISMVRRVSNELVISQPELVAVWIAYWGPSWPGLDNMKSRSSG